MKIPDFMSLSGDEDGGVTLDCRHESHTDHPSGVPVAYYGWTSPSAALPRFTTLTSFLDFIAQHADSHQLYPDVPNWRDVRTGRLSEWKDFADRNGISYPEHTTPTAIKARVRSWLEKNR